ncbi:MAG: methyltransferase domain-containing protein [Eudoraea sp.]|nr:methyltransferase domain-containing protein [Eudoraea sp.]
MKGSKSYWDQRYLENRLGWDVGNISTPMKEFIDQLPTKDLKILVPGAGNGYEVGYLHEQGFKSVYALDISEKPLSDFNKKYPEFPKNQLLVGDFFDLELNDFDLILEQTFFCALLPKYRERYAQKMRELLKEGGCLAGLFFDFPLTDQGPPFGGNLDMYRSLFTKYFHIRKLERAYNSIPPRQGTELFFIFEKKSD